MTYFYLVWLIGLAVNQHTKFEVSNFTRKHVERLEYLV